MHQIGEDKGRIREIELLKEVHDSGKKRLKEERESEALTETIERKMNTCADEQQEGTWM